MARKRDKIISYWATGDDYEQLRQLAAAWDSSLSQIVRTAVRRELAASGLLGEVVTKEVETAQIGG